MNPVGERIICAFFPPKYNDSGEIDVVSSDRVNFYHFAKVFGVFRPVSSNQDKNVCNLKEHKVKKVTTFTISETHLTTSLSYSLSQGSLLV